MADGNSIEYRPIDGYPGYRVGSDGSVWSRWRTSRKGKNLTDTWHQLRPSVQKRRSEGRRYRYLNLVRDGAAATFRLHRLILEAFVGPCPPGCETRHLDGDPGNNALSNLAWGTPAENTADRKKHGRITHRNRLFAYNGETKCLTDWANLFGIPFACLHARIDKLGMTFEQAVAKPYRGVASNGRRPRNP